MKQIAETIDSFLLNRQASDESNDGSRYDETVLMVIGQYTHLQEPLSVLASTQVIPIRASHPAHTSDCIIQPLRSPCAGFL